VDNASQTHVTNKLESLYSTSKCKTKITGIANVNVTCKTQGKMKIKTIVNGKQNELILKNVLHLPQSKQNILALSKFDEKCKITINNGLLTATLKATGETLFKPRKTKMACIT
jgi:hypothetical protein